GHIDRPILLPERPGPFARDAAPKRGQRLHGPPEIRDDADEVFDLALVQHLERTDPGEVKDFTGRPKFGMMRMMAPSPRLLDLQPAGSIAFAPAPVKEPNVGPAV